MPNMLVLAALPVSSRGCSCSTDETDLLDTCDLPRAAFRMQRDAHSMILCMQRSSAEAILKELQAQPDAWTKVDTILERSNTEQTKFFALQVPCRLCRSTPACLPKGVDFKNLTLADS